MKRTAPKECPVCGEDVPPRALACPECGACHETGWREDSATYDGLDLPDEAWAGDDDEDEAVPDRGRPAGSIRPFWRVVTIVALVASFWWLWHWLFVLGRAPWR
jgi:hypothetical protein